MSLALFYFSSIVKSWSLSRIGAISSLTPIENLECHAKVILVHKKCVHLGLREFSCDICGKQCSTKSSLKSHIINNHSTEPIMKKNTRVKCELCSNVFCHSGRNLFELVQFTVKSYAAYMVCMISVIRFPALCLIGRKPLKLDWSSSFNNS